MGKLFIHKSPRWVNYLSNEELNGFIEMYTGADLVIGDLASWNRPSVQKLLKLVETFPNLSVYSSKDLYLPILYSRFPEIVKHSTVVYQEDSDPLSYNNLLNNPTNSATNRLLAKGFSPLKSIIVL